MQQQGDYTTSNPYYNNNYPNSTPIPSPPSYASAPPFTATYNTPYNPNLLFYNPPPPDPALQQPQNSCPFPSFESHGPYQNPNSSYPSVYPTPNYDNTAKFDQNLDKYGTYVKLTESSGYGNDNTRKFDQNRPYFDGQLDNYGTCVKQTESSGYGNDNTGKFDQNRPYFDESLDKYSSYGKRAEGYGDGVFAYLGSKVEPYGARGTSSKSSTWSSSSFDDFGRPIGYNNNNSRKESLSAPTAKIVKAVPKVDTQHDVKSGVQKFRVKLLAESGGQSTQDVLCQHHCRNCGDIFCDKCTQGRTALTADENAPVVRACDRCMAEVSHRLSSAKETANRSAGLQNHEDLAKKLQEEMERNRRESSGSRQDRSGRMKEVQVPSSGSETIECGVCQHPFLVSSH